ncbi:MAG: glycosyltransferase family 1 protein, partial [Ramlibacter sp.]|nr:glycosyltransferase family 1 protein [Ramlibacter sp.]
PSLAEGFGLPLVEARARGCPVLASDLPAFAELADEGVFIFDRRSMQELEALVLQHATTDYRPRVGRMTPFTWRDSALQFLDVSRELLQSPRAAGSELGTAGMHAT